MPKLNQFAILTHKSWFSTLCLDLKINFLNFCGNFPNFLENGLNFDLFLVSGLTWQGKGHYWAVGSPRDPYFKNKKNRRQRFLYKYDCASFRASRLLAVAGHSSDWQTDGFLAVLIFGIVPIGENAFGSLRSPKMAFFYYILTMIEYVLKSN